MDFLSSEDEMDEPRVFARQATLMGSPFEIKIDLSSSEDEQFAETCFAEAFAEIRRIEDLLTDFRESPFNAINVQAGLRPVAVTREIFDLIQLALGFSEESGGAFDISYASVGQLWREAMRSGIPPSQTQINQAKKQINFRKIQCDQERCEIFLPHPDMKLGLGGIGKGYAVDRAYQVLKAFELKRFMVNGAGDIRVFSEGEGAPPWNIGVRNPFSKDPFSAVAGFSMKTGSIASSGDYERYLDHQGKRYHHVLDGRSGEVTQGVASATVFADDALTADVCATILMVLGPQEASDFLNKKEGVSGLLINSSGESIYFLDAFNYWG
ncbi:MAG: FAD:protein FMN transferase [Deltaproteobacteria bacterium]|nr:FAD:protein FMN transferase [Deltaproteobacteria bacterium]